MFGAALRHSAAGRRFPLRSANAATTNGARLDAVIAARDVDALTTLFADDLKVDDHSTGVPYDRQGAISSFRFLMSARDPKHHGEPLATLGDSLALHRTSVSASGLVGRTFDVGPYEMEEMTLIEVDAQGRARWAEGFAVDHLGDAIVRLYERYAELLPDGPARARAAATARSVALSLGVDLDRFAEAFAPDIEVVDHRPFSFWSARGAEDLLRQIRAMFDLADVAVRDDHILALDPDALLVSRIFFGNDRATGGAFEVAALALFVFGADGLLTRGEFFDSDRAVEALARFDELTGERVLRRPLQRRVRPNAATANIARLDAALTTRDTDALPALVADEMEVVEHPTGATYGRQGLLATWRSMLTAQDSTQRWELLATLGDSLALSRWSLSAPGLASSKFDVGPYEIEQINVTEVDAEGRARRGEIFASDHLGDAIVRLYERYAELLPEGPARDRATATVPSVAAPWGPVELDRVAGAFAPAMVVVDHRILGTWSARGAEAWLQQWRAWLQLVDATIRCDDILGLQPDALLCRATGFGTDRAGGGTVEMQTLPLSVFGPDGHVTRIELFEADGEAEALARFDELGQSSADEPAPGRKPDGARDPLAALAKPNAATAARDSLEAAFEARDWAALRALWVAGGKIEDRRRHVRVSTDVDGAIADRQRWARAGVHLERRLVATAGDRVAIERIVATSGPPDGRSEIEYLSLTEVEESGRILAVVAFDPDDSRAAFAEAWACALAVDAAAATLRPISELRLGVNYHDPVRVRAALADDLVVHDHRLAGLGVVEGADAYLESLAALWRLAPDDHLEVGFDLARERHGVVRATKTVGTLPEGGTYERPIVMVSIVAGGRITRMEFFEPGDVDAALARFAELRPDPLCIPRNAATRMRDRFDAAWAARDWEAIAAMFAPSFRMVDRRSYAHLDLDRDQLLASLRFRFEMRSSRASSEVLATRGDRLALWRRRFELADGDVGPSETESLQVVECDERGDYCVALVAFDPNALAAAYVELDRRYAAGGRHATHGETTV